jgi:cold shock CspA family protein
MKGTITFFHSMKGFGFVTTTEGQSYFFHISNFEKGSQPVLEGQVEFQVAPPLCVGKRPQAVSVRYRRPEPEAIDVLAGNSTTASTEGGK